MADEMKEGKQDHQGTTKPVEGKEGELAEKDLEKAAGGTFTGRKTGGGGDAY